eukprot:48538_1
MRSSNISVALHSSIDSSNSKMEVELDDGACHYTIRFLTACTSYTSSIILFLPFQFISFKNINASLFLLRPLLSYSNSDHMMTALSPTDGISTLYQAMFICFYCFHFLRRIIEVICIHNYQRSAPVFEVFGAFIYYGGLSIYNSFCSNINMFYKYGIPNSILIVIGIFIFIVGESGNCYHHYLLSKMRPKGFNGHVIPNGCLFNFVSCPHYFFELLTWFGWFIMTGFGVGPLALLLLSLITLIQRSKEKHDKYRHEFNGENHKKVYPQHRKALIPFIF